MKKQKVAPLYIELMVLLIILFVFSSNKAYQYNTWQHTTGEVFQIQEQQIKTFTGDVNNEVPVIRFIADDRMYEIRTTLLTGFNDLWAGDRVNLIYPKDNPTDARVFNILGFWLPIPSVIIMVMIFLVSIGIIRIVNS